ncbi:gliding motility lipoprotein GldH [Capnocytophaga cynodegmi]|uniref:gliding motility lipoprotein GldH n=1 Tax=Capnocytophaga cynodegmi TaxID=28189 RepID=UPI00385F0B8F
MRLLKVFFAFILLTSCNDNVEYSQYVSIPSGWDKTKPILFQLEQMDTITPKNLFVMIRNDEKYQFSNLFIITRLEQPNNEVIVDTLQYEMATPEGEWLGYGFSAVKESKLWYKENFKFPQKGKYTIKIEQAMRKIGENEGIELLDGITEVGLRIETAK